MGSLEGQSVENSVEETKLLAVFLSLMLLGSTFNLGVISILSYAYAIESSAMENLYTITPAEFSEELVDTSKITSFEIESMDQSSWSLEYGEESTDTSGSSADTNIVETFEEPVLTKVDLS